MIQTMWISTAHCALRPFPTAHQFFQHYLTGQGRSLSVDTGNLLAEDPGLTQHLFSEIGQRLCHHHTSGVIRTAQTCYQSWNWRLALGGLQLHWTLLQEHIHVHFTKTYDWNPKTRRISRPIHQAAHARKPHGAQSFEIIGHPAQFALNIISESRRPCKARFLGKLYL